MGTYMYNRHIKFGLEIPKRLGENVRKISGGGLFLLTLYSLGRWTRAVICTAVDISYSKQAVMASTANIRSILRRKRIL